MPQRHIWSLSVKSEHINQLKLKPVSLGHLTSLSVPVGLALSEGQAEDCDLAVQETLLRKVCGPCMLSGFCDWCAPYPGSSALTSY